MFDVAQLRWLDRHPTLKLISRFVIAGVLNTMVGLTVTLVLDLGLKVSPALANAAGYAVGICVSWLVQRRFVFQSEQADWGTRAKYITTIAVAFTLNQAVLWMLRHVVGDATHARAFTQIAAMGTYSIVQFLLFRGWVFRKPAATAA